MRGFSKTRMAGLFVTGAAVGAAVGLLIAPKSGMQTRRDIRKFSKKAVGQLDGLQCDIRDQINDSYDQMRDMFDNVKDYVEDGRARLRKMMQSA